MPFDRPTLTSLRDQALADIRTSGLPNDTGILRFSVLGVLATSIAGFAHLHWGYLDWIARQAVPFTSEEEYLEAWGALRGIIRTSPTAAAGSVLVSGTPTAVVPIDTLFVRPDGILYRTTEEGTVGGGGTVSIPIEAWSTDLAAPLVGPIGNAEDGVLLRLSTPIIAVTTDAEADGPITGGADAESDDSLRSRILAAFSSPARGGAASDYIAWARAVPGVTRAWVDRAAVGPGTVVVYVMLDVANAVFGGFPQGTDGVASDETRDPTTATGDQLAVADAIWPLQTVTALVYVRGPAPEPLDIDIVGLTPDTGPIRAAIEEAISDMLVRKGSPLADVAIAQSDVDAAILSVAGVSSFSLTGTWPATPPLGSLFVLGTVTYA